MAALTGCVLLLAACSIVDVTVSPVVWGFDDPIGDAVPMSGLGGTIWDIHRVVTTRTLTALTVAVTFVQPVVLPPPGGLPTAVTLAGHLNFDTDSNPLTGTPPVTATWCRGGSSLGMEYYVHVYSRLANGNYPVMHRFGVVTGEATPTLTSLNTLATTVPLAAMGGDDGATRMDMIFGSGLQYTDCAPDGGVYTPTRVRGR
jgi:hypothetical protein